MTWVKCSLALGLIVRVKISGVQVVTFCYIQNCFINTDPQSTQLSSIFLKLPFEFGKMII